MFCFTIQSVAAVWTKNVTWSMKYKGCDTNTKI